MINSFRYLILFLVLYINFNCRSKLPWATQVTTTSPSVEAEVIVLCSGPEFSTGNKVFRAHAVGESIDQSVAKRKAMTNARTELAASIQTTLKSVTESYLATTKNTNTENINERYESFSREVVSQELRGMQLICEKYTLTNEGKYKAYVAIELSAQHLVDEYYQRLSKNQLLKKDLKLETFKENVTEQMKKVKE